jgi:Tol biopolymer transport system component
MGLWDLLPRFAVLTVLGSLSLGACASTEPESSCPVEYLAPAPDVPEGLIVWRGTADNGRCPGIYSMHPDGTATRDLTWPGRSDLFYLPQEPRLSPDGRLISYIGQCGTEEKVEPDLCVMSRDGQDGRTVASSGIKVINMSDGATWSPDGTRLAFTRGAPSSQSNGAATSVHVIGLDGTGERTVIEHAHAPDWSPDGSRMAVVSDREGTNKIFLVNPDGRDLTRLTNGPGDENPAWGPDGIHIAFDSERAGKPLLRNADQDRTLRLPAGAGGRDIYTVRADGSDLVRLTKDASYNTDPAWSPDGHHIVFASNRDGVFQIWVMNSDGFDVVQLTRTRSNSEPSWGP